MNKPANARADQSTVAPGDGQDAAPNPQHPLDDERGRTLALQLESWWIEARDAHAPNRVQRFIDHDYYDHEQIGPEDRANYEERGQAPIVHNLIHPAIDWLTGTERRTRIDWDVLPRGPEDVAGAKAQTQVLKFVADANNAGFERSAAFKDACISGVGFVEEFIRGDRGMEPIGYAYSDWRYWWWDPYSRRPDFSDARYLHRAKMVDLDVAIAMCPDRAADLEAVSVAAVDNDYVLLDEMDGLPSMFSLATQHYSTAPMRSAVGLTDRCARRRVRLIETWFPRMETTKQIKALVASVSELHGELYVPSEHEELLKAERISLVDALTKRMCVAIWAPGVGLCSLKDTPYKHNRYPVTPVWCFRHHRDGMPYGYVRGMRDPQDEYNKRRAKALFMASAQQVFYESDALEQEDEDDAIDEVTRPDGVVKLAPGGLKKIEVKSGVDIANAHVTFMTEAKNQVYEGSGITRENLAQDTNAISGRAILAKQQQGAVTTAEVFDNYRFSIKFSGEKTLSLIRSNMSTPRKIRIVGGNEGFDWLPINQPKYDPLTGTVTWENDITEAEADFVVGEQDFRETVRMAMAESLFETIGKLPPEVALQLIDLAVDLTDLPNKDEFVRRVRKLNGTDGAAANDPAQQAQAAAAQRAQEAEASAVEAKADKDRASAEKLRADAASTRLNDKPVALDTAGLIAHAIPLATTADNLLAGASQTPPQPVQPGVVPA